MGVSQATFATLFADCCAQQRQRYGARPGQHPPARPHGRRADHRPPSRASPTSTDSSRTDAGSSPPQPFHDFVLLTLTTVVGTAFPSDGLLIATTADGYLVVAQHLAPDSFGASLGLRNGDILAGVNDTSFANMTAEDVFGALHVATRPNPPGYEPFEVTVHVHRTTLASSGSSPQRPDSHNTDPLPQSPPDDDHQSGPRLREPGTAPPPPTGPRCSRGNSGCACNVNGMRRSSNSRILYGCPIPGCQAHTQHLDLAQLRKHLQTHAYDHWDQRWFWDTHPDSEIDRCPTCFLPFKRLAGHTCHPPESINSNTRTRNQHSADALNATLGPDFVRLLTKVNTYDLAMLRPYLGKRVSLARRPNKSLTTNIRAGYNTLIALVNRLDSTSIEAGRQCNGDTGNVAWQTAQLQAISGWKLLLAFGFLCNDLPDGSQNAHLTEVQANTRVQAFFRGDWRALDVAVTRSQQTQSPRQPMSDTAQIAALAKRAEYQTSMGELSRAMATISSITRVVSMTDELERQLRDTKYTTAPPLEDPTLPGAQWDTRHFPTTVVLANNCDGIDFPDKLPERLLKKIDRSAAVGIDGLSRDWLTHMIPADDLNTLVCELVNGRAPPYIYSTMAGGTATLLGKPAKPGDFRPVVPQTVLIRLVGKLLMNTTRDDLLELLGPYQAAVHCPAGLEAATTLMQEHFYSNGDDAVMIQWDYKNGYGEVRRDKVRQWVIDNLPSWAPFVCSVISTNPTRVGYRAANGAPRSLGVTEGLLQGDVLSAPLYTALNTPARLAANAIGRSTPHHTEAGCDPEHPDCTPGGVHMDYIDDNFVSARTATLGQNMMLTALRLARVNNMRPAKGKMVIASYNEAALTPERWAELIAYLHEYEPEVIPEFVHLGGTSPTNTVHDGLTILGKPMGTAAYVRQYMTVKLGMKCGVQRSLAVLQSSPLRRQSAMLLFKYCVQERITYFSRTLTHAEFATCAADMEAWTRQFLFELVQWDPDRNDPDFRALTAMARRTAALSSSRGGLAVRDATMTATYAPVAAMADTLNSKFELRIFHMRRRLQNPDLQCTYDEWTQHQGDTFESLPPTARHLYVYHHLRSSVDQLETAWGNRRGASTDAHVDDYPFPRTVTEFLDEVRTPKYQTMLGAGHFGSPLHVQRRMAQWIQDRLRDDNLRTAFSAADVKRLRSQGGPGGMAFMRMIPACKKDQWDDAAFREVLRDVLGLPSLRWYDPRLPADKQHHSMPARCQCGQGPLTASHAASCILDGTRSTKHNAIARTIYKCVLAHKVPSVELEPRGRLNRGDNAGPDFELTSADLGGRVMYDFTYVDETAATYGTNPLNRTAAAAKEAERRKVAFGRDYPECRQRGIAYEGIAMEHDGAIGPALADLLKQLWQHVKNPGRANREWTLKATSAMPLDQAYDNPLWTNPGLTEFWLGRISTVARQATIDARRRCAERMNSGVTGRCEGAHGGDAFGSVPTPSTRSPTPVDSAQSTPSSSPTSPHVDASSDADSGKDLLDFAASVNVSPDIVRPQPVPVSATPPAPMATTPSRPVPTATPPPAQSPVPASPGPQNTTPGQAPGTPTAGESRCATPMPEQ